MNIIFVTNAFSPIIGGVEKAAKNIAVTLHKMNHRVEVVTARNPITLSGFEIMNGLYVHRVPFYVCRGSFKSAIAMLLGMPIACTYILYLALLRKPCIVHVQFVYHNAVCVELIRRILQRQRIPVVVTFHGGDAPNIPEVYADANPLESKILNWAAKRLIQKADRLTAVSDKLSKAISILEFCDEKNIRTIYNGVNTEVFYPQDETIENKTILSIGRLTHAKGFDILFEAFSRIAHEFPEWKLIIAGDGELRSSLKQLVSKLDLNGRIILLGMVSEKDLVKIINASSFVVAASRWEGFSLAALEVMSCGKALVATDTSGTREMIINNVNGIIVPKEDPTTLANVIKQLIKSPNLRKKMGIRARKYITDNFTWTNAARKYIEIYENLLKTSKNRF